MIKSNNKIGIFGGSFDPPHKGHLEISKIAIEKLSLDKLYWCVTKKNPFKNKTLFSLSDRVKQSKNITKKITLYIARLTSTNTLNCSAPCINCYNAMQKFEIKRVIYSDHGGTVTKTVMRDLNCTFNSSGQKAINAKRVALFNYPT